MADTADSNHPHELNLSLGHRLTLHHEPEPVKTLVSTSNPPLSLEMAPPNPPMTLAVGAPPSGQLPGKISSWFPSPRHRPWGLTAW